MTTPITLAAEGYDELAVILRDAFLQASEGKGRERHANDLPFDQQPMQSLSDVFDSDKGMAFQVVKKLREGLDMPEFDRLERELLGSIVYTAGIILWHKRRGGDAARKAALTSALAELGSGSNDAAAGYQRVVAAAQAGITKRDCPECGAKSPGPHNDGCVYKDPVTSTPTESVCEDCHREPYQNHLPGCPRGEFQAEPELLPAATVPVCPGCGRKEGHRHRRGCTTRWPELAESAPKDDPFAGAPEWAKYKAQGESGSYYWFECAPMMALSDWMTISGLSAFSGNGSPNPNWRETLIERPTK